MRNFVSYLPACGGLDGVVLRKVRVRVILVLGRGLDADELGAGQARRSCRGIRCFSATDAFRWRLDHGQTTNGAQKQQEWCRYFFVSAVVHGAWDIAVRGEMNFPRGFSKWKRKEMSAWCERHEPGREDWRRFIYLTSECSCWKVGRKIVWKWTQGEVNISNLNFPCACLPVGFKRL